MMKNIFVIEIKADEVNFVNDWLKVREKVSKIWNFKAGCQKEKCIW
jgi:hypothetical protein